MARASVKRFLNAFPLRLRSLFRRERVEKELDDEFRYHIERQTQEHVASGLTPQEARYAAMRALGGIEQRKEECRDMRSVSLIQNFLQDLRYAGRMLRNSPPMTIAFAVLALAFVSAIASYIPARRATNVEPMRALREE